MKNKKLLFTLLCIALSCVFLQSNCNDKDKPVGEFVLTNPANNATDVDLLPRFTWQTAINAKNYTLYLADNETFANTREYTNIIRGVRTIDSELDYGTKYYWRVTANGEGNNNKKTSVTFNFTTTQEDIERDDITITSKTVVPAFVGVGVQWGGYDNVRTWTGSQSLSNDDWNKLFARLRYMKPPLMRIMVSPGWNYDYPSGSNGNNFEKNDPLLIKMLDFCQTEDIDVIFGEWGHRGGNSIDQTWLETAVKFYEYLIKTKGYSCIKYYNMVNEPNGDWSSINGNYALWEQLIKTLHEKLVEYNLADVAPIIGPDIAIWDTYLVNWVNNTKNNIGNIVTAYDIHTYPTETIVRSGEYTNIIQAYRNAAPQSAIMIMGELGFKYDANSDLGRKNTQLINADKYASDDSNMMIYEAFYGIDMADVVIQNMLAGYAGIILWDLDDAMYNVSGKNLKRWGFWNILGAEAFENTNDENIRPWFYTMSLLSKYFPKGTEIKSVTFPNKRGLRAVAGIKNGKYSIAIVNSNSSDYNFNLIMDNGIELKAMKKFVYVADAEGAGFEGNLDASGFAAPESDNVTLDLSGSVEINLPARSFILYSNF